MARISSETCHQKVVQNGFPSTSESLNPDGVERDLVDFEHRALRIQKADELDHGVERDARQLLPVLLTSVAGQKLGTADVD